MPSQNSLIPDISETSHATRRLVELATRYFETKSAKDTDGWLAHFAAHDTFYADAVLGWVYEDLEAFRATATQFVANWGDGLSYVTRLIGDERSAIIAVTATPELFGAEIRALSSFTYVDDKVVRVVDYWDSRNYGIRRARSMRTPHETFPTAYGEQRVSVTAPRPLVAAVESFVATLQTDHPDSLPTFTPDAVFEDMTLKLQVIGRRAILRYLQRAASRLPYGTDASVTHIVGGAAGGGFEWRSATDGTVTGIVAVELTTDGQISRVTSVWDGGRIDDGPFNEMLLWAREQDDLLEAQQ